MWLCTIRAELDPTRALVLNPAMTSDTAQDPPQRWTCNQILSLCFPSNLAYLFLSYLSPPCHLPWVSLNLLGHPPPRSKASGNNKLLHVFSKIHSLLFFFQYPLLGYLTPPPPAPASFFLNINMNETVLIVLQSTFNKRSALWGMQGFTV